MGSILEIPGNYAERHLRGNAKILQHQSNPRESMMVEKINTTVMER